MENYGSEILLMLLSNIKLAFATFLKGFLAILLIVLVDSAILVVVTYVFIMLNVISGYCLMWRTKTPWNTEKWFKTCMKLLWFPSIIVATNLLKESYGLSFNIGLYVSAFLSVNEIKGLIDNAGTLTGIDIWNAIADQIDWKKFKFNKK